MTAALLALAVTTVGIYATVRASRASAHIAVREVVPAPRTAAAYQRLFAGLDVNEWGAADVAISVPLTPTRVVWVFGDTLSENHGIVNSTAITQDGGTLHVSQHGDQMLPRHDNDRKGRTVVYWIEGAHKIGFNSIEITAAPTWVSNTFQHGAAWGRAARLNRTGVVKVEDGGDVVFDRWTGWAAAPELDTRFLTVADGAPYQREGHLFYAKHTHPEARLSSGRTLVTICQNRVHPARTASGGVDYSAYRMIFSEV